MAAASPKSGFDAYGENPQEAWDSFLKTHHDLIMAVIRKLVTDHDLVMDLYTYTIEKLRDNDCKKLTAYFSKPRSYNFDTWVAAVVRHACMDWFRKEKGRRRLSKSVQALPHEDQLIFKYLYWHGYSQETTFELLRSKHDTDLTLDEMSARVATIHETLNHGLRVTSPQPGGSLLRTLSADALEAIAAEPTNSNPPVEISPSPEAEMIHRETSEILREIISTLPSEQQLLIQLYYYRKLTLQEIARILKMKNIWRVHRKLQKALTTLKRQLVHHGIGPSDLDIL